MLLLFLYRRILAIYFFILGDISPIIYASVCTTIDSLVPHFLCYSPSWEGPTLSRAICPSLGLDLLHVRKNRLDNIKRALIMLDIFNLFSIPLRLRGLASNLNTRGVKGPAATRRDPAAIAITMRVHCI